MSEMRIECPGCHWEPDGHPHWICDKCPQVWNTFVSYGECPRCGHVHRYTMCIRCRRIFPHSDWYFDLDSIEITEALKEKVKVEQCTKWVKRLLMNEKYRKVRFKKLNIGYPPFHFPKELIDTVSMVEFKRNEDQRIPLFIGSQFGIFPNPEKIPWFFNSNKVVAILSKSLLSGVVYGLKIFWVNVRGFDWSGKGPEKLIVFENNDP